METVEKHFTIPPIGAYAPNKFLHADIPMDKYMFGSREEVHRVARLLTDILRPLGYNEFHPPGDPSYDPHMVSSKKGKYNLVRIFVPYSESKRALKFHIIMGYDVADEELIQIAKEVANALLQVPSKPTVIKEVVNPAASVIAPTVPPKTYLKPSKQELNHPTVILGHGADKCNADGKLEELIVPPNCVYVTFGLCGLTTFYDKKKYMKFFDPNNKKYLDDPITYEKELKQIFNDDGIHVHKPGTTYINAKYTPSSFLHGTGQQNMSGVVPIDGISVHVTLETGTLPPGWTAKMGTNGIPFYVHTDGRPSQWDMPLPDHLTRNDAVKLFKYSIYPTEDDVKEEYDAHAQNKLKQPFFKFLDSRIPPITQQELFELRPGVYYNSLCRVVDKQCKYHQKLRRAQSLADMKTDMKTMLNENDIKTFDDRISLLLNACTEVDCDEIDDITKELPLLSPMGLLAIEIHAKLKLTRNKNINKERLSKLLQDVEAIKRQKHMMLTDTIAKDIVKLLGESIPTEFAIDSILKKINNSDKKEDVTRMINVSINRNIFTLEKIRDELVRGGKRRTWRKRKLNKRRITARKK